MELVSTNKKKKKIVLMILKLSMKWNPSSPSQFVYK